MEVTDAMALGRANRQHRKLMGLTQRDAAGLCGVGERFLSEMERGKETASFGKVFQVIKKLGLLSAIGRESAGALSFWPEDESPFENEPGYSLTLALDPLNLTCTDINWPNGST